MSTLSSDLETLSHEAYVYFYPLVTMEVTRRQSINTAAGSKPGFGPSNVFHHLRAFPEAEFRSVVRPNFDTLYSSAWLDLTAGPVVLHAPDTEDRYYMLPLLDMWTDVFAVLGKRATGTDAQDYAVVGPGYSGELPSGVPVIVAPTPYVWIIGRTQTNGPADYPAVHAVQDGLTLTATVPNPPHPIDPEHDTSTEPITVIDRMSASEFFAYAAEIMKVIPSHATDFSQIARIASLGIVPGQSFDPSRFDAAELAEIDAGVTAARTAVRGALATLSTPVNGWASFTNTIGVYGNYYLFRALVTLVGLGANPPEDAIYPVLMVDADGDAVTGEQDYTIHFNADALPPAAAFWSITMYDGEGFQSANELNRFAIGDRDPLTYNPDGSLDILIGHENPGPDREPNWLPAPNGPLGITARLYAPKPEALDGRWRLPAVHKA